MSTRGTKRYRLTTTLGIFGLLGLALALSAGLSAATNAVAAAPASGVWNTRSLSQDILAGAYRQNRALDTPTGTPPPEGDSSVTYQVNTSHDGNLSGDTLAPPLQPLWSVDLGGGVSYPLVVGNMVYVSVAHSGSYGTSLYALNAQTGANVWGPIDLGGTYSWSGIAYDQGQVFAVTFDGLLRAFNAQTGAQTWIISLPGQYAFTSPPAGRNGILYVGGAGSGGTVYAVQESNGTVLWTAGVANGDHSSPAVSDTGVYVSYSCTQVYDFDPLTGYQNWHYSGQCSGGGGRTPALYGNKLYVRDEAYSPIILDATTGNLLGAFSAGPIPAFDGNLGFFLSGGNLHAIDQTSGTTIWNFGGDGSLSSAPIVVNHYVYIGSTSGHLYVLDETSGAVVFTANLPAGVSAPDEHNVFELVGLSAGSGELLVPASTWLVAYTGSNSTPPPTITTTPTATGTPPTATSTPTPIPMGDSSVAYQMNTFHSGSLTGDTLAPPLQQLWSVNLSGTIYYPLVVGDMVYADVANTGGGGTSLYALRATTGAVVWGPVDLGGAYWSAIAYDEGQIFSVDTNGLMRAFNAQTGAQSWIISLPGQYLFSSPPTARNGVVYTGGAGSGGTVYAVQESNGTLLWTGSVMNGDDSSPAVSDTAVYVSYACEQTYDFDPITGHLNWHYSTGCEGGGGSTTALNGNRLYVRDWVYSPIILDATTGNLVGAFTADRIPALDGNLGFFLSQSTLRAIDQTSGTVVWSFTGDGSLTSAPIVVNGHVYMGSSSGHLYALNESDGTVAYSTTLPAGVAGSEVVGLGAGSGRLVVPASNWLVAFAESTGTATPTPSSTPSSTPTSTPGPCTIGFSDVHPTDYFYEAVNYLWCHHVISGYADNTFRPYSFTTRGQMTKIVVLGFGIPVWTPEPSATPTFSDVPREHPFFPYIETAAHERIVTGYSDGTFRPGSNVTRGQLSKIIVIAATQVEGWFLIDPPTPTFLDVPTDHPFYTYIETAYCHQIINGYAGNLFLPGNDATRGQISKITYLAILNQHACGTSPSQSGAPPK